MAFFWYDFIDFWANFWYYILVIRNNIIQKT